MTRLPATIDDSLSNRQAEERAPEFDIPIIDRPSKRIIDICIAALLLLVTLPTFLAIAVLVAADGGPVFYAHQRIARGGRTFGCLKFRSMRPDADAVLANILATNPEARHEWATGRKLRRDPRVTALGRLLRSTSLDELPQLLNVLRGDMSLVGPRPVTQEELEKYYLNSSRDAYLSYLSVRPGITGPWQISGRSDTSYNERIRLDTDYTRTLTLRADLAILAKTCVAVIRRKGAW